MSEPDHERLRRDLESAATEARAGAGRKPPVTGRQALIGLLAAVPIAAGVIAAIAATQSGPELATATTPVGEPPPEPAVPPSPPRPTTPRAPATSTGPDVPPRPQSPRPEPPRSAPPEPAAPPGADRSTTHTVQPGETLARIALHYRVPLEQIAEQNAIADPDRIRAGANLVIRPAPANEVVIPAGATLTGLASRHHVTVSHLLRLNPHIADADRIVAGGRLRIS
ncbi:LysM peptidoglycan-binding domain-containing protein [Pseudonocardia adelaidensis]|uniref:LysM domain-containing protein n=1 Tax=Pseudonocardia adelaidensis TaxID=648754 RepID=A0ABP9NG79_9PSEU